MIDELDAAVRGGDASRREELMTALDSVARDDHGLEWRYIPGGAFRMGSEDGDHDEYPVRDVWVDGFYMSATTVSMGDFDRLMKSAVQVERPRFHSIVLRKMRGYYGRFAYYDPERTGPGPVLPLVSASFEEATELANHLTSPTMVCELPTEAEWERAARGLLHGARYSWGDEDPTDALCDFDNLDEPKVKPSRSLPPNDYGLYGMCGSLSEWCRDHYDASFYLDGERDNPLCQLPYDVITALGSPHYVLRGGSWADCAEACSVSFRQARRSEYQNGERSVGVVTPTIGIRLVLRPRSRSGV